MHNLFRHDGCSLELDLPSTFGWIPPTLSVLKCNNFPMPATENEENQYQFSITLLLLRWTSFFFLVGKKRFVSTAVSTSETSLSFM